MQPDILPSCLHATSSNLQYVAIINKLKRPDWLLTTTTGVWAGPQLCDSTPNYLMHSCGRMFTPRIRLLLYLRFTTASSSLVSESVSAA